MKHALHFLTLLVMATCFISAAEKTQLRVMCSPIMPEAAPLTLATKGEGETGNELAVIEARASFISELLPLPTGELHLIVKKDGSTQSLAHVTIPADCTRGLLILAADKLGKSYHLHFIDTDKAKFAKGSVLLNNFTSQNAAAHFGPAEKIIAAGQQLVVTPVPEENGMYQLLVKQIDAEGKSEPCYDRYISHNKDSREIIFLLPDEQTGLRVTSLPLFSEP